MVAAAPITTPAPFEFTGDGAEYFRIWVINLLLTLATLGIYSAWAKVRKARYFWQTRASPATRSTSMDVRPQSCEAGFWWW